MTTRIGRAGHRADRALAAESSEQRGAAVSRAFAELLPRSVAVVARTDDAGPSELWPAEAAAIARAVEQRRLEFATVRHCARRALAALGQPAAAIPPGPARAPVWPPGIRGSLTHCRGVRAAALTDDPAILALGIDAEPNEPLPEGVLELVTDTSEQARLSELAAQDDRVCWDRLLFSAKESIFKTWYPLTQRWLGFEDCRLMLHPDGSAVGDLLVVGPTVASPTFGGPGRAREVTRFEVCWSLHRGHLLTACHLAR